MKKSTDSFRIILLVLGTIAAAGYVLFLIGEGVPVLKGITFAEISVFLLFVVFVLGYYFLWTNEILSGLLFIAWHVLQWCLVLWIWQDGGMTLILGIPIGLYGIFVLIYGIRKKVSSRSKRKYLILSLIILIILYLVFLFIMTLKLGLWN